MSGFVQGSAGLCYAALYLPEDTQPTSWVICFPPFAEEMNKSRAMMSAQGRALAERGVAVIIPDLYGTGDSFGGFGDADWDVWCNDLIQWVDWIRKQGAVQIYFWGIRLGCLLALEVLERLTDTISGLLFWQPVCNGHQMMTQFLRLRMAAGIMDGTQETVADLRQRLQEEGKLEVAGYEVSAQLVGQIDGLSMQKRQPDKGISVTWFEVSSSGDKPLPVVSRKIVDEWQGAGVAIEAEMNQGELFWMTQEISMAPALIQRSTEVLTQPGPSAQNTVSVDRQNLPLSNPVNERCAQFDCHGELLPAIVNTGNGTTNRGVLIVVGGPQYRVGSHRQFVLLARALAKEGVPVFRFDYRGMGDAGGSLAGFEAIHDDIAGAIDSFMSICPEVEEVVIWGLCDAATAAAFYAPHDNRIQGLVLLNPWVRSGEGEAKAYIRHYYLQRLLSRGFWRKLLSGRFQIRNSLESLIQMFKRAFGKEGMDGIPGQSGECSAANTALAPRMEKALEQFDGKVLMFLSGNDLTAAEFNQTVLASPRFRRILEKKRFNIKQLKEADHTFSRKVWRDVVALETTHWLTSW